MIRRVFLALCLTIGLATGRAAERAQDVAPLATPQARVLRSVAFRQQLDAQTPVDLPFQNDRGETVTLHDCLDGRPAVLVLAYYRCPMLCNQVLIGVAQCLKAIGFSPGEDFNVVVVSFDPTDTVELAAAKKTAVVDAYGKGGGKGWDFLIGQSQNVQTLAHSVGFEYQFDPATNQFAHASGIVLLTPSGRTSHYFYGIEYPTRDVRLGLVDASEGRIGSPVDEFLLYCFHYDPLTGKYGLAIMRVMRLAGIATVAALAGYIAVSLRREKRQAAAAADSSASSDGSSPAANVL